MRTKEMDLKRSIVRRRHTTHVGGHRLTEIASEPVKKIASVNRSGLSVPSFARELGISPRRLYWWGKRLSSAQLAVPVFQEFDLDGGSAGAFAPRTSAAP